MLELFFAASLHLGIGDGWNQNHPGLRYVAEDFTVGAYLNSEDNWSVYGSHTFEWDRWSLEAGLVTGYSGGDVIPMVVGRYAFTDNFAAFASPAYGNEKFGAVVGLELTIPFGK